uniref:DUF148 domain-containing protein n=1 Tax=Meloidogyne hapla TaxID=6305 RepID=A0A1I8B2M9_MELHA
MVFKSFHAILIVFNLFLFCFHHLLGQEDMSGSLSLKVVYNGKDVDTSGIKQLFSDGKDDMTLISTVPSVIKDQMPNDLKSALEKETIGDLKKEIGNTKNAIKESKTSKELKEKLEKVAPETKEVYDKTINWVYSKMGLDKQDEDFVEQVINKHSLKYKNTIVILAN